LRTEEKRITTRITKTTNDWLDAYSDETGISKSTLVKMALEKFKKDVEKNNGGIF